MARVGRIGIHAEGGSGSVDRKISHQTFAGQMSDDQTDKESGQLTSLGNSAEGLVRESECHPFQGDEFVVRAGDPGASRSAVPLAIIFHAFSVK